MNYILITPVKNEELTLPKVAECLIKQTQLPILWVIIDGNSSDSTFQIAKELSESFCWIAVINQKVFSKKGAHTNFSLSLNEAYEFVTSRKLDYVFIGKLDSDQIIPPNFFEFLINQFIENPKLGAASGSIYSSDTNPLKPDVYPKDELPDKRLYRKDALEDIGGFPITKYSPDTVVLAKLRMRGWEIKSFPEISIINMRKDGGLERNHWASSVQFGRAKYYLGYHPLLLLMGCGYTLMHQDVVKSIGLFYGYMSSWMKKDEVTGDKEIWEYFRYKRIREVI